MLSNIDIITLINSRNEQGAELSLQDVFSVSRIFKEAMLDSMNSGLSEEQQKILLDKFIKQIHEENKKTGNLYTEDEILRGSTSNKHMIYFDNFLEWGEGSKIVEKLRNVGLYADELAGVSLKDIDTTTPNGLRIVQKTEKVDKSIVVVEFELYYQGKRIYRWVRDVIDDEDSDYYDDDTEVTETEGVEVRYEPEMAKQKEGSKSKYVETYYFRDSDTGLFRLINRYQRETENGDLIIENRDEAGKFVPKWLLEELGI